MLHIMINKIVEDKLGNSYFNVVCYAMMRKKNENIEKLLRSSGEKREKAME